MLCAEFLETNYDKVFSHYQRLLNSENYVTRRQSLKLLGELLLDRHNFSIMTRYITNPDNLKLMMNMLKEKSRNIQFEAFHVFKVLFYTVSFCKYWFYNTNIIFRLLVPLKFVRILTKYTLKAIIIYQLLRNQGTCYNVLCVS